MSHPNRHRAHGWCISNSAQVISEMMTILTKQTVLENDLLENNLAKKKTPGRGIRGIYNNN